MFGVRAFFKGKVAAHVDDGIDVLDHHRAFLDAGTAGGARPQRFGVDQAVDDWLVRVAAMLADRLARVRAASELGVGATGQADDHVLNQFFRVQRLASGIGRAHGFTFTALHAGIEPEQLVPGEVHRFFHAQRRVRVFQVQRLEAGGAAATETFGTAVPGQVQGTGEGVLHRAAPGHAEEQLRHAPQHTQAKHTDHHPATGVGRQNTGDRQGGDEEACSKHQQAFRQAHPRALRQARRWVKAAFEDKDCTGEHDHRGDQQRVAKNLALQAEAVHQDRQGRRQHKAARRGDVSLGHVFVAFDHVVQVDQVASRHGQQAADQIDLGRSATPPHAHPAQGAEHRQAKGSEQQNG